ncbi:MAG: hypothetical protein Q8P20_05300 [bacterium]|nr:hypothetical protein [bacterium]
MVYIIVALLLLWYGFLLIRPINIFDSDIGRLISNGEIIFNSFGDQINSVSNIFNSNFYSHTNSEYPFLNHHWGSGVIFYLIWKNFGFIGLHVFFILLTFITFLISFFIAYKKSNLLIASTISFFLIPVLSLRSELRPEIFSYFFLIIFLWILQKYKDNPKKYILLYILPLLMIIWVNIHIYYIFGLILIFLFLFDSIINKTSGGASYKKLALISFTLLLAGMLNPNGISGLLYPLHIFANYGVLVKENISILSAFQLGLISSSIFIIFVTSIIFSTIIFIILFLRRHKKIIYLDLAIIILFTSLAWLVVRGLAMYALLVIPVLSGALSKVITDSKPVRNWNKNRKILLTVSIILLTLLINKNNILTAPSKFGFSDIDSESRIAKYIIDNKISGTVFNDFNTGSYIIFHLYPNIKPFVDSRPEAYPIDFFKNTYYPIFEENDEEATWTSISNEYDLSLILLKNNEITNKFIKRRAIDPAWDIEFFQDDVILFRKVKIE